jgi:parallel beta-helix repeat protein
MMRIYLLIMLSAHISLLHAQTDVRKKIQTDLIMVEDGDTVYIPEGVFSIDATLSMEGKKRVVVKGAGMERTILNFAGQVTGAEGLRVSASEHIIIEDLTVRDAKGDAVKTMNVAGITFRRVRTDWSGKPKSSNGAYGLYPVRCSNVLIEECVARGASDAGIYVGQSSHIIVRGCKAFENVAGIEIENSTYADVYNNEAYQNTGGILVFDLPDLQVKRGGYTRVYDNLVRANNLANFAPKGNIVGKVPQGTGIILLAANHVEIFRNRIYDNRTVGTSINSYYITENKIRDKTYDPFPTAISVHDNDYMRKRRAATMRGRIGKLYRFKLKFGRNVPDIVFDGILDDKRKPVDGNYPGVDRICISGNKNAGFANIDAANDFKNISRDVAPYTCVTASLPSVTLPGKR